jgi:hypothetical protein
MIQAGIGHDTIYPGSEGALEAEAIQFLVSFYKCLLMDVLSVALRPSEAQREP